ncbi:MAG: 50S ribosomal protein L25 [Candidatus Limnocylindrales bacterium]
MSSAPIALTATSRTVTGKSVAHLRKAGQIPAVVFGHGIASVSVSLDAHEFDHLRRVVHSNTIIELNIDGKDQRRVLIHGFQIDPRNRRLLHVDLFALKSGEEVTVEIPLHPLGESFAVARLGGTLLHNIDRVKVRALPEKLPEAIEFSIESLVDFETSIHLRELMLPPDVTLLSDPDEVVAKVAAPHVVEEPVVEEAEEAEEAAAEAPAEGEAKTEE